MNDEVKKFLAEAGRKGGDRRASMYSKAQIKAWGKKGGRPRKITLPVDSRA